MKILPAVLLLMVCAWPASAMTPAEVKEAVLILDETKNLEEKLKILKEPNTRINISIYHLVKKNEKCTAADFPSNFYIAGSEIYCYSASINSLKVAPSIISDIEKQLADKRAELARLGVEERTGKGQ